VLLFMSGNIANSSSHTITHSFGIYTEANSTALSLLYFATSTFAQASATNQSTAFQGPRFWSYHSSQFSNSASNATTPSLNWGSVYYIGHLWATSSEAKAISYLGYSVHNLALAMSGTMGVSQTTGATSSELIPWVGLYASAAIPTVVSRSSLQASAGSAGLVPLIIFENSISAF